jgi:HEAT repeat protein
MCSHPVIAQERPHDPEVPREQISDLDAFMRLSATEVAQKYFDRQPYRLFAIRRLIELGDPAVVGVLERAFTAETEVIRRCFIAAALVTLRDPNPDYFKYVVDVAYTAIKSDLPFPVFLSSKRSTQSSPAFRPEFLDLVRERGLEFSQATQKSTFELPGAVEALGEAGDPRSLPTLLEALHSPNIMIIRAAAFGLARLHDNSTIQSIVEVCSRLPLDDERRMIAKSLLYFDSATAQEKAMALIDDSRLFQRWQAEVKRRGWKRAMQDSR